MSESNTRGRAALAAACEAFNRAAEHWDAEALALVYTEDALFFGGRPGHRVGRAAIRDYFASYAGVIRSSKLDFQDQHVVELAPDVFLAQGFGQFTFVLDGDKPSRSMLRTSVIVVRADGTWRVRQWHFSTTPSAPPLWPT
jgi:uncharacterized protein (TIGR02246 family)